METTALYRHFSSDGALLYVGISNSAVARLGQHMLGSAWKGSIASVTIEHLPSREAALEAERLAIIEEKPAWNRKHNRKKTMTGDDFFEIADSLAALMWIVGQNDINGHYIDMIEQSVGRIQAALPDRPLQAVCNEFDHLAVLQAAQGA